MELAVCNVSSYPPTLRLLNFEIYYDRYIYTLVEYMCRLIRKNTQRICVNHYALGTLGFLPPTPQLAF